MKIKQFGNIDIKEWLIYLLAFLAIVQLMSGILSTVLTFMYAILLIGVSAFGAVLLYKQLVKTGYEKKWKSGDTWLAISLLVAGILLYYFIPPTMSMAMYSVFR